MQVFSAMAFDIMIFMIYHICIDILSSCIRAAFVRGPPMRRIHAGRLFQIAPGQRKGDGLLRYDMVISFVAGGMSIYIMWTSSQMKALEKTDLGPGAWPYFLGASLLLLSVGLLAETLIKNRLRRRRRTSGDAKDAPPPRPIAYASPGLVCVYKLCGLLVVFAVLLRCVNLLFAMFVFIPSAMWVLGERKKTTLAVMAAAVPLSIYLIFAYLLRITLP